MNACVLSVLCLLGALAVLVEGVTVQDGDLSFPLESVKKLKGLREVQEPRLVSHKKFAPRLPEPVARQLCSLSAFPEALRPVCEKPNAEEILQRLEAIAQDPNTCEICAYAACTGC
ncbi:guanylin [Arvicanthis niloticus]|uniref:guanylin n=1 Tax=Arvicanthis niloticus TaxID=61156 RepID=UPI0014866880|nr:guanylin [Arvicanthis niloticus]